MELLVYGAAAVSVLLALGQLANYLDRRDRKTVYRGIAYLMGAVLTFIMGSWIPLAVGFVLAFLARFLRTEDAYSRERIPGRKDSTKVG